MGDILKISVDQQEDLAEQYRKERDGYEEELALALLLLFKRIGTDFHKVYKESGIIIKAHLYEDQLIKILTDSYIEVMNHFSATMERNLKIQIEKTKSKETRQRSALILAVLLNSRGKIRARSEAFIIHQVSTHSELILNTTQNVLDKTVADTIIELSEELDGEIPNRGSVADKSSDEINKKNKDRVGTISETEVGQASAKGKQIEAETLQEDLASEDLNQLMIEKRWISLILGDRRESHLLAHGQIRELNEPFWIDNYQMMTPRDGSLGAPLGEIINCKCESIYT